MLDNEGGPGKAPSCSGPPLPLPRKSGSVRRRTPGTSIISSAVVLSLDCVVWAEGKPLVQPECKEGFLDKVLFQRCPEK